MKILITGVCGFVGSVLAESLMAGQRDREALAYLQILWEREP